MKVHRIEVMVVDHDGLGANEVRTVIESTNYPNDCIRPKIVDVQTREVEWTDDHPLNQRRGWLAAFRALFA